MKFADLHLHTVFSDGTYTPRKLVVQSKACGLCAIAVVDHDTVEAIEPVTEAGGESGLEVLPGIELTAEYAGLEIHILGYLIDYKSRELKEKLKELKSNRIERIYKMSDKLKKIGIELNPQAVFKIAGCGTVGRLHLARAMVKEGVVGSVFEAFNKYIGDKGPAFVLGFRFSPQEAIKLIRKIGGISVLAHPYTLHNDEMIPQLLDYGIMGLEVFYSEHTPPMLKRYLNLAQKHNLLVTGGSDCHGEAKPKVKIGSVKVPYELVEKLKAAKEKL